MTVVTNEPATGTATILSTLTKRINGSESRFISFFVFVVIKIRELLHPLPHFDQFPSTSPASTVAAVPCRSINKTDL